MASPLPSSHLSSPPSPFPSIRLSHLALQFSLPRRPLTLHGWVPRVPRPLPISLIPYTSELGAPAPGVATPIPSPLGAPRPDGRAKGVWTWNAATWEECFRQAAARQGLPPGQNWPTADSGDLLRLISAASELYIFRLAGCPPDERSMGRGRKPLFRLKSVVRKRRPHCKFVSAAAVFWQQATSVVLGFHAAAASLPPPQAGPAFPPSPSSSLGCSPHPFGQ